MTYVVTKDARLSAGLPSLTADQDYQLGNEKILGLYHQQLIMNQSHSGPGRHLVFAEFETRSACARESGTINGRRYEVLVSDALSIKFMVRRNTGEIAHGRGG